MRVGLHTFWGLRGAQLRRSEGIFILSGCMRYRDEARTFVVLIGSKGFYRVFAGFKLANSVFQPSSTRFVLQKGPVAWLWLYDRRISLSGIPGLKVYVPQTCD